jgi:diaminobutyrate-2-oxoglutarate transaminase
VAKGRFLEALSQHVLLPRGMDFKVQFCGPTGTNAVEAALKLARKVTGRHTVVAFSGAYHGMSLGSTSVTASRGTRQSAGVPLVHTHFVPYEDGPAGPFDSLGLLERMLADPCSGLDLPAAIILECIQMDGGVYVASAPFLRGLRELCDRHGILLIVDDIQAGCGRSGRFFSFEHAGITPDLVTVSKSIGGAGLPMSLLLIRRQLDQWAPGQHTGTFRGNQLAFVAATAVLEHWREGALERQMEEKSLQLRSTLEQEICARHRALELRGTGMVYGLDFRLAGGTEVAARVQQECFRRGLIIETCGREDTVVKLLPPLTTPAEQLAEGLQVLRAAVDAALEARVASEAA